MSTHLATKRSVSQFIVMCDVCGTEAKYTSSHKPEGWWSLGDLRRFGDPIRLFNKPHHVCSWECLERAVQREH